MIIQIEKLQQLNFQSLLQFSITSMYFKSNIDVVDGHDKTTWSIDNLPNSDIMEAMSLKLVHEFAFDIDFERVLSLK